MIVTLRLTQTKIKHALGKRGGCPRRLRRSWSLAGASASERRMPGRLRQNAARQSVAPGRKLSTGYPQLMCIVAIIQQHLFSSYDTR